MSVGANARLVSALAGSTGRGRAIVVGCGKGDDAEYVASLGFSTVAFDISPSIAAARRRFPGSPVEYVAGLRPEWTGAFDLVVEVLAHGVRRHSVARIAEFVAPGGRLLVIARDRAELTPFGKHGLTELSVVDFYDTEPGDHVRCWRAWFAASTRRNA